MKSLKATLHFSELLLVLLKGKTGLIDALHVMSREGIEQQVRDSAGSLLIMMKKGKSFSESLRNMKDGKVVFEPLYITLIVAAELTGDIKTVLERIVIDLKRKLRAKENAGNIMIYPAIIILLAVAGTIVLISRGLPLFISNGILSENVALNAKAGIGIAGAVMLSGGSALFIAYFRIFNDDSAEFRIFYLLDFLLRSNVSLLEAFAHCIASVGNTKYGSALVTAKKEIASGIAFSAAFSKIKHFSPYVAGWLSVADVQGNFNEICGNIGDYYALQDKKLREIAEKLIEPAIIVLTGIYVLIIMVTVVLPILTYAGGVL
ncbi:MAG: type II secretion system F family protein [Treponema sp.]|jgi:type IV pilus assembly protein PilC|nr:type II secretion system F family protein [Treponema sp.]